MQIILSIYVKLWLLIDEWKIRRRFYSHSSFAMADKAFKKAYRGLNPYRICRQFLESQGVADPHAYGETPLTTLGQIVKSFGIHKGHKILELGSGRGRGALFLKTYVGCRVTAVEWVPSFNIIGKRIVETLGLKGITFTQKDMMDMSFDNFDYIYLFGTCLSDASIDSLIKKFIQLSQTKIITVSFSLNEYSDQFAVEKAIQGKFPWGKTEIYLNRRL